jgi:hypothetical protein
MPQDGHEHIADTDAAARGARCGMPATTAAMPYWLVVPSVR